MHLIRQHSVSINCNQRQLANQIKDELSSVLQADFYPKLEKLLMSYDQQNSLWQIDHLPITIDNGINTKNWKTEIVDKSIYQIKLFLDAHKTQQNKKTNKKEHIQNLLLLYLKTGVLQQNAISRELKNIYNELEMNTLFIKNLKVLFKGELQAILRWSLNIPLDFKLKYLQLNINPEDLNDLRDYSKLKGYQEYVYWINHFNKDLSLFSRSKINQIKKYALVYYGVDDKIFDPLLFAQNVENNKLIEEPQAIINDTMYYVNNAGLVLLHPFLSPLFKKLGYLKDEKWKSIQFQHRAVLLCQYLINFNAKIFEHDLVLNKILIGVPIRDIISTAWKITKQEKEQCESLLRSVIEHWKILKKTSIRGLQDSFLQRDAKIERLASGKFEITVEQKSIDLLLDQLPWGIGMIKTPWMEDYLTCQWN